MIADLFSKLSSTVIPPWARWVAIAALVVAAYGLGRVHEARHDADARVAEAGRQASATVKIVQAQAKVVVQTEVIYRDRIQKVYVQEKQLEADIPKYIPVDTDRLFTVPVGFVRVAAAAWTGVPAGPAADTDREPSGVSFSELAGVEVSNATSCRVWREQALGWRAFYADQQIAINGKAGAWYQEPIDGVPRP